MKSFSQLVDEYTRVAWKKYKRIKRDLNRHIKILNRDEKYLLFNKIINQVNKSKNQNVRLAIYQTANQ